MRKAGWGLACRGGLLKREEKADSSSPGAPRNDSDVFLGKRLRSLRKFNKFEQRVREEMKVKTRTLAKKRKGAPPAGQTVPSRKLIWSFPVRRAVRTIALRRRGRLRDGWGDRKKARCHPEGWRYSREEKERP